MMVNTRRAAGAAGVAGAATLVLLSLGACKRGGGAASAQTAPTSVLIGPENIVVAKEGSVQSGPVISGALNPEKDAEIRAQTSGPVLQTLVEQGQRVTAGQLLARIDDTALREAALSARSAVTSARTSADVAARDLDRQRKLYAAGAVAQTVVDQAERTDVAARATLSDAESRLALSQKQLSQTQVAAPFAGVVGQRAVSAGDVVQVGTLMFSVVDPRSMQLQASVPAEQLALVHVGAPVSFTANAYPGRTFTGRVTRVSPVADPATRQVQLIAQIPNDNGALVGGVFAQGRLASESASGVVVPLAAVDNRTQQPAVMKLQGGKVVHVNVQLGLRDDQAQTVAVTAGVQPNDTLLTGPAQAISPGTAVQLSAPVNGDRTTAQR